MFVHLSVCPSACRTACINSWPAKRGARRKALVTPTDPDSWVRGLSGDKAVANRHSATSKQQPRLTLRASSQEEARHQLMGPRCQPSLVCDVRDGMGQDA